MGLKSEGIFVQSIEDRRAATDKVCIVLTDIRLEENCELKNKIENVGYLASSVL